MALTAAVMRHLDSMPSVDHPILLSNFGAMLLLSVNSFTVMLCALPLGSPLGQQGEQALNR